MSPIQDLIARFQELIAQVPEVLQPVIVMVASAVPATLDRIIGQASPRVAATSRSHAALYSWRSIAPTPAWIMGSV